MKKLPLRKLKVCTVYRMLIEDLCFRVQISMEDLHIGFNEGSRSICRERTITARLISEVFVGSCLRRFKVTF